MSDLAALFAWTLEVFRIEFTIYGFTFSLWQVFAFGAVAAIIGRVFLVGFLGVL